MLFDILDFISRVLFILAIFYYSISLLQWYNYSAWRVLTKHHRFSWHLKYFVLPIAAFIVCFYFGQKFIFYIYLYVVYLPMLIYWASRLDKRVVFTRRVWRSFVITAAFAGLNEILFYIYNDELYFLWLMPLVFSFVICEVYEAVLMRNFVALAKEKLSMMSGIKIVMITASFGKTSIKNFLFQILQSQYNTYCTPRSVNTFKGIVMDINQNLAFGTDVYIAEAGARQKGDISQIATFLNPQYGVIGEIGKAHIEYFKTIEQVAKTKYELLESERLRKVLIYQKNELPKLDARLKRIMQTYPPKVRNVEATLENTKFELEIDGEWVNFKTNILGRFNVDNIAAAILLAREFSISIDSLKKLVKTLTPIEHRLNLSISNGKTIIDDGFNGNLNGILEGIYLCSQYKGRKVIVTPGLIESDEESNITLAKAIDSTFDLAIITGEQNSRLIASYLHHTRKVQLREKTQLENVLKGMVGEGDLVYFANDAPSYV